MTTKTWTGAANDGKWESALNWSPSGTPTVGDDVTIGDFSASLGSSSSIASLALTLSGLLQVNAPGTPFNVAGGVSLSGNSTLRVDIFGGQGGSVLNIGGALTTSANATVQIGTAAGNLAANTTVTAQSLVNIGLVELFGQFGPAATNQATLNVTSAAPNSLSGALTLQGDALTEFASGHVGSIITGGDLALNGVQSRVADAGQLATNSALTALASNAGTLELRNGASVTTTGTDLSNSGNIYLDRFGSDGGASLTVGGVLTNVSGGFIQVGTFANNLAATTTITAQGLVNSGTIQLVGQFAPAATNQATLDILAAAPGSMTGSLQLSGDALAEFSSGQVTAIGATGNLALDGAQSRVADAGQLSTNSALTALASNAGTLELRNGASVTTTGTDLSNSGNIYLDRFGSDGGASLTVGGVLTNVSGGFIQIGTFANNLTANSTITAQGLVNSGTIDLIGQFAPAATNQATLDILAAAPGSVTGSLQLSGDALAEFSSGHITAIGATGNLALDGAQSRVADAGQLATNSALTALANDAGTLELRNGASVTTTGTDLSNSGNIYLDRFGSDGGASLTVGGVLTNVSGGFIQIGTFANNLTANSTITAQGLVNSGAIDLIGQFAPAATNQATLDILAAAPGSMTGSLQLSGDALAEFSSGHIGGIALGADLTLDGAQSRVADTGQLLTNSALVALASNAGTLEVRNGASVTTGTDFNNTGALFLDRFGSDGGASLSVGGVLTNATGASLQIGTAALNLTANTTLTAQGLVNGATIQLFGAGANLATLALASGFQNTGTIAINAGGVVSDLAAMTDAGDLQLLGGTIQAPVLTLGAAATLSGHGTVAGALANGGSVTVSGGLFTVTGALSGAGGVTIGANGTLELGAGSASAITFAGASATLQLDATATFAGAISGFGATDALDLRDVAGGASATLDGADVLHVFNGASAQIAAVQLAPINVGEQFTVSADGHGGTNIVGGTINNAPPTITAPVAPLAEQVTFTNAIGGVSVTDADAVAANETITVTVSASLGLLFASPLAGHVAGAGLTALTISGSIDQVNADLATLSYEGLQPGADHLSIHVDDGRGGTASSVVNLTVHSGDLYVLNSIGSTGGGGGGYELDCGDDDPYCGDDGGDDGGGGDGGDDNGDPHLVTFSGVHYDLQAVGEFVLAKSTVASDPFQVQIRTAPWFAGARVAVTTEVAVQVGADRVTVDLGRANPLWVDGHAVTLPTNSTLLLAGGRVKIVSPTLFTIVSSGGEKVNVAVQGTYLNVEVQLGANQPHNAVQGLLGTDTGSSANDFTMPDGTVLQGPLSYDQLYHQFANAWRVTDATSLLDYGQVQTTATFTNLLFPTVAVSLADLPVNVLANATAAVDAAAITDPGLRNAAILDFAVTGDPNFIAGAQAFQRGGSPGAETFVTPTGAPTGPVIGVAAVAMKVTEAASGATPVTFQVYRTGDTSQPENLTYAVITAGAGSLAASDFGGTLPTGQVTIAAGQTSATFNVNLPGGIGALPQANLMVQIASAAHAAEIVAPTAQVEVLNSQAVVGTAAAPAFYDITGSGALTQNGNAWTLALGALPEGVNAQVIRMAIANVATSPADMLSGTTSHSGAGATVLGRFRRSRRPPSSPPSR